MLIDLQRLPSTLLRLWAPSAWQVKNPRTSRKVAALIATVSGAASPCRRAATLGVSPSANCSWRLPPPISPTTTRPGMDAQAHRQLHPLLLRQAGIEFPHGLHNAQAGAHGPLGVIFVRLGIAKVDQQAVAEILGDIAARSGRSPWRTVSW